MAISERFQRDLNAKNADKRDYSPRTREEAEKLRDEMRASGLYRRVEIRQFNNGSRARPIAGYFINAWLK